LSDLIRNKKSEDVIAAVTICDRNKDGVVCKECAYRDKRWDGAWKHRQTGECCYDMLRRDNLTLLKKQEPQYPTRKQGKHGWFFYCPKCETILNDMARPRYCDRCGQAVKWI